MTDERIEEELEQLGARVTYEIEHILTQPIRIHFTDIRLSNVPMMLGIGNTCEYQSDTIQAAKENQAIEDDQTIDDLTALAASQREQQDAHLDPVRTF
ncbi:hypothetical protein [Halomicrobium salinisoli]|uniref:hypothetical protein n=1 Tax=Halomicrobium salinisoli TaxID=2878391 RepID=UPI001CF05069|nr:hypothetical protein [Halomicrobium salinisoli]